MDTDLSRLLRHIRRQVLAVVVTFEGGFIGRGDGVLVETGILAGSFIL